MQVSEELAEADFNGHSASAFIFSSALRESDNKHLNYEENRYWNSTSSGTMKGWLENVANLKVTEFSYGHEYIADGIASKDLPKLMDHVNGGNMAVLFVAGDQFIRGSGKSGAGSDITGGDHFIVLSGSMKLLDNGNKVSFTAYDQRSGKKNYTWDKEEFMDMVNRVLMVEKKEKEKE